jgi:hypothetical protein
MYAKQEHSQYASESITPAPQHCRQCQATTQYCSSVEPYLLHMGQPEEGSMLLLICGLSCDISLSNDEMLPPRPVHVAIIQQQLLSYLRPWPTTVAIHTLHA